MDFKLLVLYGFIIGILFSLASVPGTILFLKSSSRYYESKLESWFRGHPTITVVISFVLYILVIVVTLTYLKIMGKGA